MRALVAALALVAAAAHADIPRPVTRAFLNAGVTMPGVALVVQEAGALRPLFTHQPLRAMNPASTMKLVTTLAALELLGRDYRWKTEAYLGGRLADGTLRGDLILKGYGDPKLTVEQWQAFMAQLRANGLANVQGDLALDRTFFKLPAHDSAEFDAEPQKPYNVGPDALLLSFKSVRFVFAPDTAGGVDVRVEPPLPQIALGGTLVADGAARCNDWRATVGAAFLDRGTAAGVQFNGRYPLSCGERDWYVALLDHPTFVQGMFQTFFAAAGGQFAGAVKEGRAPANAAPFATLESPPLYDVVRDINKLSNNVMARQVFLTLSTKATPPPATPEKSFAAVKRWLAGRKLAMPELVMENGSGLSRNERISAGSLAHLLAAADASAVREEFASSLAVAAVDGTVQRRFQNGNTGGQALLKTGSLEGVRALAGYVIDAAGRRWIVVAIVNHPNAARAQSALDALVDWTYNDARHWQLPMTR
jgi:D-alanyl-D-alanine carboxypeptidase/D-alanyl-D-alanine-endopeptidase (penicillin-binding protein 4)